MLRLLAIWILINLLGFNSVQAYSQIDFADSLFSAAMEDTTGPLKDRISQLKKIIRSDRDHSLALHQLGRLHMSRNTVSGRIHAQRQLKRAMVLEPDNVEFQSSYGELLRRQGFFYNSKKQFEKILEMDPENAEAACQLGDFLTFDLFKYMDARRFDGKGSMRSFGEESGVEAASYYQYAILKDPYCRRAYYGLGFLSLESAHPEQLIALSESLLERYPGDRDGLLFLGLGHMSVANFEEADNAFREALARMPPDERWVLESPELIATDEVLSDLGIIVGGENLLGAELSRFWTPRDPLLLTGFNERRLSHYSRVAYANLRFSKPDEGVTGWETDMGRVWIRFGKYLQRERLIIPFAETWFYDRFRISFYSYDSLHWKIDLFRDDSWEWADTGYGRIEVLNDKFKYQDRYIDPYADRKYKLPTQIALFKSADDQVRVDISWALPKDQLGFLRLYDTYQVALENGVFVLDLSGNRIEEARQDRGVLVEAWEDTLKGKYLLDQSSVTLSEGSFVLSIEVEDKNNKAIGTFQDTLDLELFDPIQLSMSSLLLATTVEELQDSSETSELNVIPNPTRAYARSELLYPYFEIYNLSQDDFGQTNYTVEYRIGRPGVNRFKGGLNRATRKRLKLDDMQWTVAVTSDYRGSKEDESLYLGVDLSAFKPGLQLLALIVTDLRTGVQTSREALFWIFE